VADILERLIVANRTRVERWHGLHDWTPLEWAGAMCGETGEAANAAKKLKRVTTKIAHNDNRQTAGDKFDRVEYARQVAHEVADAIIYGALLCDAVEQDLVEAIRVAFNTKSEEYGFPERL
jgi:NTP pyrophosphatase (non-canonical NTP hydrolase)